jgi:hypothetical protein
VRIREIERDFGNRNAGKASDLRPLAVGLTWSAAFKAKGGSYRTWRIMLWPHVALPHVVVMLAGIGLLLISTVSDDPRLLGRSAPSATPPPSATPR